MVSWTKNHLYKLLRWTEKYAKTDMVYLAKEGTWLSMGQVLNALSVFFLSISFGYLVPRDVYGTYKFVLSIVGICTVFTLTQMEISMTRSIAKGFDGSLGTAVKTRLRWGLLAFLVLSCIASYYALKGNYTLFWCYLISAVFMPLMETFSAGNGVLAGKKLFKISMFYNTGTIMLASATMIATAFFNKSIYAILLAYFIAYTVLRFVTMLIARKKYLKNNNIDPEMLKLGKELSFLDIVSTITSHIDKILTFHYLGAASLAIYAFARAPMGQILGFLKLTGSLALPKFSTQDKEIIKKTLPGKMFKFSIIIGLTVIVYIILAPYFFKIFYPKYTDAVIYSQFFAATLVFFPKKMMGLAILAHPNKNALRYTAILSPIVNIILLVAFLPTFGLWGLVAAEYGTNIFNVLNLYYFFRKL